MDVSIVRRFAELQALRTEKEAEVDKIKAEMKDLEAEILEAYAEEGLQSMNVTNGVRSVTVYMNRTLRARNLQGPEATAAACENIPELADLVKKTVNANSLSSALHDLECAGEPLPEGLAGVVEPWEQFTVGVRAS